MIGFWIVNLLIPGDPDELIIKTPSGKWSLTKSDKFQDAKQAIGKGQCAHTYAIETSASMDDGAAVCDAYLDEMTPILLGASYLLGLSVTAKMSVLSSDLQIIQPTSHWPRERAMGEGSFCINNEAEFAEVLEKFVAVWPTSGQTEKALILIHHWLDALGCWSFEDFYLSATTLLQIIAATEEDITRNNNLPYFTAIQSASRRAGIQTLTREFKDMRNNLIHEGKLLGGSYSGRNIYDCSVVAANLLNWFDNYIHSVLNIGAVRAQRFRYSDFISLNSYSM
jgi:hypothetical protein